MFNPFSAEFKKAYEQTPNRMSQPSEFLRQSADQLQALIRIAALDATESALAQTNLPESIKRTIRERHIAPTFEIFDGPNQWTARLSEAGFQDASALMEKDEILMVLHLPRIFSKKEYVQYRYLENGNLYSTINFAYSCVQNAIWETIREFSLANHLFIERINPPGIHDSTLAGGYYYLFRLAPTYRESLFKEESEGDQIN